MFGLFDQFNTDDPTKQARLAQSLALLEAGGPSRVPVSLFQGLGMAGKAGLEAKRQAQKDAQAKLLQDMQLQQFTSQQEELKRRRTQEEALANLWKSSMTPGGPGMPANEMDSGMDMGQQAPQFDRNRFIQGLGDINPMKAFELAQKPEDEMVVVGGNLVNKRTGQVRFAEPTKPEKPLEIERLIAARDAQPPNSPTWKILNDAITKQTTHQPGTSVSYGAPVAGVDANGNPVFFQPTKTGGAPSIIPGVAPPKAAGAEPSEGERKAATLLQRLRFSQGQIAETVGLNPSANMPQLMTELVRKVSETGANAMTPADRQKVESAQLDILDAALTLGTGAAYTREQLEGYRKSYFPQLLDKPENIKAKQERLQNVINAAEVAAGRAMKNVPVKPNNVDALINKPKAKFLGFEESK